MILGMTMDEHGPLSSLEVSDSSWGYPEIILSLDHFSIEPIDIKPELINL